MQFNRTLRHGPRIVTSRQIAAYHRSNKTKREKLPLFAELIGEGQASAEDEMARRVANDVRIELETRTRKARQWREVRARLFALPPQARAAVLHKYSTSRWHPREAAMLASMIWSETKHLQLNPADCPPLAGAERLRLTRELNDRARAGDTHTRPRHAYSPGAMAWLAPGFEPDADYDRPRLYLHTSRGRKALIWDAVAGFDAFGHNTDPTGERRCGLFEIMGTSFRFEIVYQRPGDDEPTPISWNLDLAKRAIWIGLAEEALDLNAATFASGWTP